MLMLILLILAAFFTGGPEAAALPAEDGPTIEISGGYGGIAKLGAWSPFCVKVKAADRTISGEIQVEANLDGSRKVIIEKPVELAPGTEQDYYFEIPVVSAKRRINFLLVEGKRTLAEEAYSFSRLLPPEVMLIGVLSDEPEAFGWLNGNMISVASADYTDEKMKVMIAAGVAPTTVTMPVQDGAYQKRQAVVVALDRDNFPDKNEVMDGFDYILINGYDTSLLGKSQISALESWVETGGILMLGMGMNWQKVYHGLPDTLKLYAVNTTRNADIAPILQSFTEKYAADMTLPLAQGTLGFEYIPLPVSDENFKTGEPSRWFNNDIIVGDAETPLAIKYGKGRGSILLFTFDLAAEPFASWMGKVQFFENTFKFIRNSEQRFYERSNGFYLKQVYTSNNLQNLANQIPEDRKPPFAWMFITLGIYIVIAGPVLYIILKKLDRRDWAWMCIPALSILFLAGMYLLGFKSRYNTAIVNTASLIEVSPDGNEAIVTSSVGIFNNRRGTLKLEYSDGNGIRSPFIRNEDRYYSYYGDGAAEQIVAKYTIGEPVTYEQYDVMLWTPIVLNAGKTVPFGADILQNLYLRDGKLAGRISNTSPYNLLDTVVIVGTNILYIGDVLAGDTKEVDIPLDSENVYERPDEFLDGVFGRTYYYNNRDIPSNYAQMMQRRSVIENYLYEVYNQQLGTTKYTLLARNNQTVDYGLTINDREPQKYFQNLIRMESELSFTPGEEVEIPHGIITASMYQEKDIGWQEGSNLLRIAKTGELEFLFILPDKLDVTSFRISIDNYIPLYVKYNMEANQNINMQTGILSNVYEYYLYNVKTQSWDIVDAKKIEGDPSKHIGSGNEIRMKVKVVQLGQPDTGNADQDVNIYYEYELLEMPEIYVRGVAK